MSKQNKTNKINENRPVVHARDGIYIRDKGMIPIDPLKVTVPKKNIVTRGKVVDIEEPVVPVEQHTASRFDCVHEPKK